MPRGSHVQLGAALGVGVRGLVVSSNFEGRGSSAPGSGTPVGDERLKLLMHPPDYDVPVVDFRPAGLQALGQPVAEGLKPGSDGRAPVLGVCQRDAVPPIGTQLAQGGTPALQLSKGAGKSCIHAWLRVLGRAVSPCCLRQWAARRGW